MEEKNDDVKPNASAKADKQKKVFSENRAFFVTVLAVLVVFGFLVAVFVLNAKKNPVTGNVVASAEPVSQEDTVVAVVDGEKLFLSDLETRYATVPEQLREQLSRRVVLDNMIGNTVVLQEAKKNGVSVPREEVDREIDGRLAQVQDLINSGVVSQEFLRKAVEEFLTVDKYLEQFVFAGIIVPEQTAREFFEENKEQFEQVRASHILVKTQEEADEIAASLKEGSKFEDLAKEKSQDTGSAQNGGDLGFFSRQEVVKEFSDLAFSMDVADDPKITKTQFGYHVVIVTGKLDYFEDFKDQIDSYLLQLEKDNAYRAFIEEQKKAKQIQVLFKG